MQPSIPQGEANIAVLQQKLVEQLKVRQTLTDVNVEAAFRAIPRHLFLPEQPVSEVYQDQAIVTKSIEGRFVSSSSQPSIMAIMLEQLALQPGENILEIGAGTGYNAALMASIVGKSGRVVTVDIDEDIVEGARTHLKAAGIDNVQVICGDGGYGYAAGAPYDRILLTVNASDIAPAWLEQLKPGGRLLLPLTLRKPQVAVAFDAIGTHLESVSLRGCGFIGLRGMLAEQGNSLRLRGEQGLLSISSDEPITMRPEEINRLLDGPSHDIILPFTLTMPELFGGLLLWLALHEARICELVAFGPLAEQEIIPELFRRHGSAPACNTFGIISEQSLSLLFRHQEQASASLALSTLTLGIRSYGSHEVALRLQELILDWERAGRPNESRLHISAYPQNAIHDVQEDDVCIAKKWTRFVCHWDHA